MYANGRGMRQDNILANMWFTLAADKGHEQAFKNRDFLANLMTPGQIAEAQRKAREWMAKHQQ